MGKHKSDRKRHFDNSGDMIDIGTIVEVDAKLNVRPRVVRNAHKYCISIWIASSTKAVAIAKPQEGFFTMDMLNKNPEEIRSGTLTLVHTNNRYFGITCNHVIEKMEELNTKAVLKFVENGYLEHEDVESFSYKPFALTTVVKSHIDFSKYSFIRPRAQYPEVQPDIRIAELDQEVIKSMGKKAIDLDEHDEVPPALTAAIAVGFPENLKRKKTAEAGSYIAIPHSTVTAHLQGTPSGRFTMHSIVSQKVDRNFSGMSGGPIFWSEGMRHNILGIIFESPNTNYDTFTENEIVIRGELATPKTIKGWIEDLLSIDND